LLAAGLLGLALAGPAGAGEEGARRPSPAATIVGGGVTIGPVVGAALNQWAVVALRLDDVVYPVSVDRAGAVAGTSFVVFEAPDCTGPPLLVDPSPGAGKLFRLTGVAPGAQLLVASGPAADTPLGSTWNTLLASCDPFVTTRPATPAVLLFDLADLSAPLTMVLGTAPAGAGRTPAAPLLAVDAAGQVLGPAYPDGVRAEVVLTAGRVPGWAGLAGDRFTGGLEHARFESPDCSGPVLVQAREPGDGTVLPLTAISPGGALQVARGDPVPAVVRSRWSQAVGACEATPPEAMAVLETGLLIDLTRFVPPFTVR
jgi:hypothetical protein